MKVDILDGLVTLGVRECQHPGRPGKVAAITIAHNLRPEHAFLALTLEEADSIWRALEKVCTDEKVRRAEAARGGPTP